MPVPVEIESLAQQHACFSGCYASGNNVLCLADPNTGLEPAFDVQCQDCLVFRLGGLVSRLGSGLDQYRLAQELTARVAAHRGYALSFAGYHTQGGGFWLSAAYWAQIGVFLLKSDRGKASGSEVDLLIKAFATGVAMPLDHGMNDKNQYAAQRVFLNVPQAAPPASLQALLSSSNVSTKPAPGFVEVTLAEYLPVARAVVTPAAVPVQRPSAPTRKGPLSLGERCEVCGQRVTERALLTSTYIGCGCD